MDLHKRARPGGARAPRGYIAGANRHGTRKEGSETMLYDEATMTPEEEAQLEQEYMEQEMLEYGRLVLYSDALDHEIMAEMSRQPACRCVPVPMR